MGCFLESASGSLWYNILYKNEEKDMTSTKNTNGWEVTFSLSLEIKEKLVELANELNISFNDICINAVREYVEKHKLEDGS